MSVIRPATPGLIVCLAALVLLVLVSVSTPLVKSIYFLSVTIGATQGSTLAADIKLGVWGFCIGSLCEGPTLGYTLDANELFDIPTSVIDLPNALIHGLTYALIVHPIAAGVAALAVVCALLGHVREMSFALTIAATWFASIASALSCLAFIFDMVCFTVAKSRINDASNDQVTASASYGNAIWMTLAAFVLLFISGCFFGCGRRIVGARNANRQHEYKPALDPAYAADARQNAMLADKLRQNDHSYTSIDSSKGYAEQGLPAFAETSESVPMHYYGNNDAQRYDEEAQSIAGVGRGYGRRDDAHSTRTGTTAGAAGLGAAGGLYDAHRPALPSPNHIESFQSMYPERLAPSPPVTQSYAPVSALAAPHSQGYGGYPAYGSEAPSPTSMYAPSSTGAPAENVRYSAVPFAPGLTSASDSTSPYPGEEAGYETPRAYYSSQMHAFGGSPDQVHPPVASATSPIARAPGRSGPPTYRSQPDDYYNQENPYATVTAAMQARSQTAMAPDHAPSPQFHLGDYYGDATPDMSNQPIASRQPPTSRW